MPPAALTVVTGGSSGIGLAIARRRAERGDRLLLIARGAERLERAAGELGAEALVADLAAPAGAEALRRRLDAERSLQLLVNCAGAPFRAPLLDHDHDEAERALALLYLGMARATAAAWPGLVRSAGGVINVVSVAGAVATGAAPHYAAAKHAALAWSRALHVEARAEGIRVMTANPGPVSTAAFPHERLRAHPQLRRLVLDDARCADLILSAWDRGRAEAFQPEWWRAAAIAQAVAPGTLARIAVRARRRLA